MERIFLIRMMSLCTVFFLKYKFPYIFYVSIGTDIRSYGIFKQMININNI